MGERGRGSRDYPLHTTGVFTVSQEADSVLSQDPAGGSREAHCHLIIGDIKLNATRRSCRGCRERIYKGETEERTFTLENALSH